ncbi:MAG: TetR/AcrR family transcriptional regulator [Kofleriaceae bacterium]
MPWDKQFDVEHARHQAMVAFWSHGYEATSMQQLLDAMGIQRGSFYATFASKHQLLIETLRQYDDARRESFASLAEAQSAQSIVRGLFEQIAAEAGSRAGQRGCYLVNSALELAPRDAEVAAIVTRAFAETEAFFKDAIAHGQRRGEVAAHVDPVATARALLGLLLGLRVLARSGAAKPVIAAIVEQATAMVR